MYGYISACVDDKFSKPFKSYLGEDAVYNLFIVCPKKINIVMMLWKTFEQRTCDD